MQTSRIIEIDGVFIGAALRLTDDEGWRFVAADHRAGAADGATAATLAEAQLLARRAFIMSRGRTLEPA